ncbi:GATA transcription factor 5 isoform X1 [Musa acuminata AAA Group]|uniref:GATA transcription factor 5 isoform X1 n=1 Tax=Musa acuminata AAA Group TaxID=214697 RepID=UPI0031D4C13B
MLHGTPITSSSPSLSLPLRTPRPASVPPLAYSHCSQGEKESNMEVVNANLRPEILCSGQQKQQNQVVLSEEAGWAVERGNIMGEAFSVDDLLNLGEFVEDEMEAAEEEAGRVSQIDSREAHNKTTHSSSSSSSSSSGLTFELPLPLSDICLPAHDAAELEWVSFIIDDSISEFPSCSGVASLSPPPSGAQSENLQARAAEPQGQGPSFLVPNVCALSTEAKVPVKAKRSKRSRSATATAAWSMSGPLSLADSSSCSSTTTTSSASSCSSTSSSSPFLIYDPSAVAVDQSFLLYDHPPQPKKQKPKKRGRKPKTPLSTASGERRCSHCGAQKTPQWRAGPLGAKTLCNACGVRFKSGRLLPEYRPACSPTFVSHKHSNSHRKVLEMRRKKEAELLAPAASPPPPLLVAVSL